MIIINKHLVPKGYAAIALCPFIIFAKKEYVTNVRINHERIHLQQQKELLIVFFYLWYLIDFIRKYRKFRNWSTAYQNIVFEKEAYNNESDINYLQKRKLYSFIR